MAEIGDVERLRVRFAGDGCGVKFAEGGGLTLAGVRMVSVRFWPVKRRVVVIGDNGGGGGLAVLRAFRPAVLAISPAMDGCLTST